MLILHTANKTQAIHVKTVFVGSVLTGNTRLTHLNFPSNLDMASSLAFKGLGCQSDSAETPVGIWMILTMAPDSLECVMMCKSVASISMLFSLVSILREMVLICLEHIPAIGTGSIGILNEFFEHVTCAIHLASPNNHLAFPGMGKGRLAASLQLISPVTGRQLSILTSNERAPLMRGTWYDSSRPFQNSAISR